MTRTSLVLLLLAASASAAEEKRPPQAPPGTVTLPLAEYDRLLDRAAKPPKRPEPPPVAAVLARADVRVRVASGTARGSMALDGEVFRTGPAEVRLLSGSTLLDARLTGRPLPLVSRDGGVHAAVLTGPAPFSVTLEWGGPVVTEPGRASFILPVPPAGSVRATIEVPGEQADIHVEPGLVTGRTAAQGRTVIEATLEPDSNTRVWWSSREAAAAPRAARFLSDVKTLVTVGEADLRMAALVDVTVLQGEPERFEVRLPEGFELTGASGSSLEKTEETPGVLVLVVREPERRRHQFLVSLERATAGGSLQAEAVLPTVEGAQRETGEAAVEGVGTLELTATESDGMRRMDVREAAASLRSLARQPALAAFRYQRKAGERPRLGLDVKRFPDAPVLAAVAERAVVTTLTTTQGRTLTEIALTVRNHAQPFLKVALPEGATLLSADVAGEAVKPVKGADGTRVPLLRPGFRPNGPYAVSFVYLQPGTPLGKKGEAELGLPSLDIPVNLLEWELFLPDRYQVKDFGGNVLPEAFGGWRFGEGGVPGGVVGGVMGGPARVDLSDTEAAGSGRLSGRVTDESGAPIPGATVTVEAFGFRRTTTSGVDGSFAVEGLPSGEVRVSTALSGFRSVSRSMRLAPSEAKAADVKLKVGGVEETLGVAAEAPMGDAGKTSTGGTFQAGDRISAAREADEPQQAAPSANVFNLQRRVAGVLPVRVDVPRAGASYRFVRPLVVDEETTVRFRYKAR